METSPSLNSPTSVRQSAHFVKVQVTVILVFTKYGLLYNEKSKQRRKAFPSEEAANRKGNADNDAAADLKKRVIPSSTSSRLKMLPILTRVTRKCLHDVEGDLLVLAAQQTNAQQKVNYSIDPLTALCLGAHIVDLTLILHNVFIDMLTRDPPRPLAVTRDDIDDTLQSLKPRMPAEFTKR
ncbi:hypothetical protein D9758_015861 [Tetrapyrgos nigripes]|uniref:Uncharacterized protein n=1 Tax=Tetrapyrgos nigripes TaxID=182062 RepID=A0A8H5CKR4_9AGAR|nr:hypothetical protein D9758_015861 [Tetrapyrgos nigripes]